MAPRLSAAALRPVVGSEEPSTTSYLPLVARRNISSPPPLSPDCPFGLQIAALHQIGASSSQSGAPGARIAGRAAEAGDQAFASLVEALEASGACWTRVRFQWLWMQPEPPPADYASWSFYDETLGLLADTGVRMLAIVDDAPDWAADLPCDTIYEERLDDFADFLQDLVSRYKEPPWNIHHWELRNEPDGTREERVGQGCGGFDGDRYGTMLSVAYPAIKAVDPEATILMGGLAHDFFYADGGPFYRYFADGVMAAGGSAFLDALNIHYFPSFAPEWEQWAPDNAPTCGIVDDGQGSTYESWGIDIIAKSNHLRNRMNVCFGVAKPLWITELAERGSAGDEKSLVNQARYVIKGNVRALAAGAEQITWFALVSPPYDPHQQGLLYEDDWSPKPAFYAYQALTSELAGREYYLTIDEPDVEGYSFRRPQGPDTTVVWGTGTWTVDPAGAVRVVDRYGQPRTIRDGGPEDRDGVQNGKVQLAVTNDPVFVSRSE